MSSNRMVAMFWVGSTIVLGMFFENVFVDLVFHLFHLNNPTVLFDWQLTFVLGFLVAIAIAVALWMQPRVRELAFECAQELAKTTWPTRSETQTQTIAVLVATAIFAGILGVFDAAGSKVMTGWLPDAFSWLGRLGG